MSRERKQFALAQREAVPATKSEGCMNDKVESHPAYGQIAIFRTNGMAALYGSDFPHQQYISLEISESDLHRGLSRDWHYPKRPFVRIEMSEAQWAALISSIGLGAGSPCTIRRRMVGGTLENMPTLQLRNSADLFHDEGKAALDKSVADLDRLIAELSEDAKGLSKSKRDAILSKVTSARGRLAGTVPFIKDQFAEHLEEREEKSKTEVIAWIDSTVRRAGLDAIRGEQPLAIEFEPEDTPVAELPPPENLE